MTEFCKIVSSAKISNECGEPIPVNLVSRKEVVWDSKTKFDDTSTYSNTVYSDSNYGLELSPSNGDKSLDFTTPSDYLISDSDKLEVASNTIQHAGEAIPVSCLYFSRADSISGNYSKNGASVLGVFWGTENNGEIADGKIKLDDNDKSYYKIPNASPYNFQLKTTGTMQEGCLEFDFAPLTLPNNAQRYIFWGGVTNSSIRFLWNVTSTPLNIEIKNNAGTTIKNASLGTWNPSAGTYRMRLNIKIDTTTPANTEVKLYINNEQFGVTMDDFAGTMDFTQWDYLYLGSYSSTGNVNTSAEYDNIAFFDDGDYAGTALTKHLGFYTDSNLYVDTTNNSQMDILTTITSASITSTIPDGAIKVLVSNDSRTTWLKLNAEKTAWVASSTPTIDTEGVSIADYETYASLINTTNDTLDHRFFIKTNDVSERTILSALQVTVQSGYVSDGTYTSKIYDSTYWAMEWLLLRFSLELPTNTSAIIRVRASDNQSSMGDWSSALSNNEDLEALNIVGRYVQFKAEFGTLDEDYTPLLRLLGIKYDNPEFERVTP